LDSILPSGVLGLFLSVAPFLLCSPASAQAPTLGSAAGFAVLAGSTVTNTGASAITGDVGVAPGTAITGFPPGIVTGTMHPGDATALQAQSDVTIAFNALTASVCTTTLTGQDLGGLTLTPGVYCYAAAAQMTGTLTLDGQGSSTAVFIIKTGSTLTTAASSAVHLINGASAANVFWQIGSSATLGATTAFAGNVIALASITLGAGSSVSGRVIARTAAVAMDTDSVVVPASTTTTASWTNYGVGWPGTAGIPTLVLSALPVLGTSPNVVVQNVRGAATFGSLIWGTGPVSIATLFGGDLQVAAVQQFPTALIGVGSLAMPLPIPLNQALSGVTADLQVLEFDQGASHFVAFTRGLHIVFGH
jgi:hypothetical protein